MLQQLGAHPLRVRIGLVDLVDGDDHRDARRLGVLNRLDGLGHHAVIGRHHDHDDVRHLGATGAHGGEGRVAGGVDEGHEIARGRRHLIGTDMLGDATSLTLDHVGRTDRVEQRGLAVIDVTHDRDDRRTRIQILLQIRLVRGQTFLDVRLGDAANRMAHLLGDELSRIRIDHVGDLVDLALLHQQTDDVHRTFGHAVGEFLDGDRLWDCHVADDFLLGLLVPMPAHPLLAAAEGGHGTSALFLARSCVGDGEAATVTVTARRLRRLGRRNDLERHTGATNHPLGIRLLLGRGGAGTTSGTRSGARTRGAGGGCRGRRLLGLRRRGRARHEVQVARLLDIRRDGTARLGRRLRRSRTGRRRCRTDTGAGAGRGRTLGRATRTRGRRSGSGTCGGRRGRTRNRSCSRGRRSSGNRLRCRGSGSSGRGLGGGQGGDARSLFLGAATRILGGLAAEFVFLTAPLILFATACLGSLTLAALGFLTVAAGLDLGLGTGAGLGLATLRIGQGGSAGIPLLLAQGAQHDARGASAGRTRGRGRRGRHGGRTRRRRGDGLTGRDRSGRGADRTPLHRLDHDGLRPPVGEALTDRSLLDRTLDRQRLRGGSGLRLVTRIVRIAHSV